MASVDPARVARIVREVAEAAVLPRFRNLAPGEIKTKSRPDDLVTIADTESERLLTAALTALLPGSVVVGEEAVAADASVLARLEEEAPVWILDPVDGTLSFANGDPGFAMIVALAIGGRTVAGWIHDPVGDRTAYAGLGEGAWIDGRRVHAAGGSPDRQPARRRLVATGGREAGRQGPGHQAMGQCRSRLYGVGRRHDRFRDLPLAQPVGPCRRRVAPS